MKTYEQLYDENGKFIADNKYQEIILLDKMLTEADIPHVINPFYDGLQVCYPEDSREGRVLSALQHFGSYGNQEDLIEIMGLLTPEELKNDIVAGCLSAKEVFNRIKGHYDSREAKK